MEVNVKTDNDETSSQKLNEETKRPNNICVQKKQQPKHLGDVNLGDLNSEQWKAAMQLLIEHADTFAV